MACVTIYTTDGGEVQIQTMPDEDAMSLIEAWSNGETPLTITLDDTGSTNMSGYHIVRIDIDKEVEG